jgi:general secretion pathway protein F
MVVSVGMAKTPTSRAGDVPNYDVRVIHPAGVKRERIDAPDRQALAALLGVSPQHVLSAEEITPQKPGRKSLWRRRARFPLQLFSQELAVLLDAGISLLEAIKTLQEKEASASVRRSLEGVIERLQEGQPFSSALREQPDSFDELLCAIVAANERSGQLAPALAQHARHLVWVDSLRQRLVAACVYPLMLLGVGGAVILFLLLFVLPRFAGILDGLGGDLPWGSRVLVQFGSAAGAHPLQVFGGLALLIGALVVLFSRAGLRQRLFTLSWTLPGLGPRLRVLALARLYRSLGMLLASGVPVLQALHIVHGVVAMPWRDAVARATSRVEHGERLSESFEAESLATPVARRMLRVGERSGEVPAMLERAAAFHDEEAVRLTELLTRLVNPALMLLMGLVIGGIIVLMYLPIFQLVEQVQ